VTSSNYAPFENGVIADSYDQKAALKIFSSRVLADKSDLTKYGNIRKSAATHLHYEIHFKGYDHTLLKTIKKVAAEFSIIYTCYNLRRAISILGVKELIKQIGEALLFVIPLLQGILNSFKLSLKIYLFFRNNIFP